MENKVTANQFRVRNHNQRADPTSEDDRQFYEDSFKYRIEPAHKAGLKDQNYREDFPAPEPEPERRLEHECPESQYKKGVSSFKVPGGYLSPQIINNEFVYSNADSSVFNVDTGAPLPLHPEIQGRASDKVDSSVILDSYISDNKNEFLKDENYKKESYDLPSFDYDKYSAVAHSEIALNVNRKAQLIDSLRRNRRSSVNEHHNLNRYITPPSNNSHTNLISQTLQSEYNVNKILTNSSASLNHYDSQSLIENRNPRHSDNYDRYSQITDDRYQVQSMTGLRGKPNHKNELYNDNSSFNLKMKNEHASMANSRDTPRSKRYIVGSSSRDIEIERKQASQKSNPNSNPIFEPNSGNLGLKGSARNDFTQLRFIDQPLLRRNSLSYKIPERSISSSKKTPNKRHTFQLSRDSTYSELNQSFTPRFSSAEKTKQKNYDTTSGYQSYVPTTLESYNKYSGYPTSTKKSPLNDNSSVRGYGSRVYSPLGNKGSALISNTLNSQSSIQELNSDNYSSGSDSEADTTMQNTDIKEMNLKIQNLIKDNFNLKINNQTLMDSLNQMSLNNGIDTFITDFSRAKANNIRANQKIAKYQAQISKLKNDVYILNQELADPPKCDREHGMNEFDRIMFREMEERIVLLEDDLMVTRNELKDSQSYVTNLQTEYENLQRHCQNIQNQLENKLKAAKWEEASFTSFTNSPRPHPEYHALRTHNTSGSDSSKRNRAGTADTADSLNLSENSEITFGVQSITHSTDLLAHELSGHPDSQDLLRIIQSLKKNRDNSIENYDQACRRYESELAKYDEELSKAQKLSDYLKSENLVLEKDKYQLELKNLKLESAIKEKPTFSSESINGSLTSLSMEDLTKKIQALENHLAQKDNQIDSLSQSLAKLKVTGNSATEISKDNGKANANDSQPQTSFESSKKHDLVCEIPSNAENGAQPSDEKYPDNGSIHLLSPNWLPVDNAQFEKSMQVTEAGFRINEGISFFRNPSRDDLDKLVESVDDIHLGRLYTHSPFRIPALGANANNTRTSNKKSSLLETEKKLGKVSTIRKSKPFGPYV